MSIVRYTLSKLFLLTSLVVSGAVVSDGGMSQPGTPTQGHQRLELAVSEMGQGVSRPMLDELSGGGLADPSCRWPDQRTLQAIVPVATDHGNHASGVVFAQGYVLTAAHAVQGGGEFFVDAGFGFEDASLMMVDHRSDLAILSVSTYSIAPLPLALMEPTREQAVWASGYPRAQGMITSAGVFQRNRKGALHTSASIDSGQSGGGLLACTRGSYHLAGLLRGYGAYLSGDRYVKLENHSVAVAASTIQQFLSRWR